MKISAEAEKLFDELVAACKQEREAWDHALKVAGSSQRIYDRKIHQRTAILRASFIKQVFKDNNIQTPLTL